jgi:hypothetical protein
MPFFVNDGKHWRERAQEARALAAQFADSVARENMLAVAAAYDRMADRIEKHPIVSEPSTRDRA